MDASGDELVRAGMRLIAVRERRAQSRSEVRRLLDALEAEAKQWLGAIFASDDPVTGRPVCLLVKSDDLLSEEYEQQTPRPLPDSDNRLTIEALGRTLTIAVDDFGRVRIDGVAGAQHLRRMTLTPGTVAFHAEVAPSEEPRYVAFSALLAALIEDIVEEETVAFPSLDEPLDRVPTVRGEEQPVEASEPRNTAAPNGV